MDFVSQFIATFFSVLFAFIVKDFYDVYMQRHIKGAFNMPRTIIDTAQTNNIERKKRKLIKFNPHPKKTEEPRPEPEISTAEQEYQRFFEEATKTK
jgi:hypothetical protein